MGDQAAGNPWTQSYFATHRGLGNPVPCGVHPQRASLVRDRYGWRCECHLQVAVLSLSCLEFWDYFHQGLGMICKLGLHC